MAGTLRTDGGNTSKKPNTKWGGGESATFRKSEEEVVRRCAPHTPPTTTKYPHGWWGGEVLAVVPVSHQSGMGVSYFYLCFTSQDAAVRLKNRGHPGGQYVNTHTCTHTCVHTQELYQNGNTGRVLVVSIMGGSFLLYILLHTRNSL